MEEFFRETELSEETKDLIAHLSQELEADLKVLEEFKVYMSNPDDLIDGDDKRISSLDRIKLLIKDVKQDDENSTPESIAKLLSDQIDLTESIIKLLDEGLELEDAFTMLAERDENGILSNIRDKVDLYFAHSSYHIDHTAVSGDLPITEVFSSISDVIGDGVELDDGLEGEFDIFFAEGFEDSKADQNLKEVPQASSTSVLETSDRFFKPNQLPPSLALQKMQEDVKNAISGSESKEKKD